MSTPALLRDLRGALASRIHGLSFSAYGPGQGPDRETSLTEPEVRERLSVIAPYTKWIRTFSCTQGNEIAPRVAREFGLKTMVGAWIGEDAERNSAELEGLADLAREGLVDLAAVGNEVLLRGEMDEDALIGRLDAFRAVAPGVPVATVDAYFLFVAHPRLAAACDYLPLNCYPFWEEVALERAVPYAEEMVRRVRQLAPGKPVIIAETGWPSAGGAAGAAVPSLRNMALYLHEVLAWSRDAALPLFWFSGFDEAWKVGPEGDCGAFWGLWDADGRSKLHVQD
jgi:exo-beta-1,3-glucanase (GH17 family)